MLCGLQWGNKCCSAVWVSAPMHVQGDIKLRQTTVNYNISGEMSGHKKSDDANLFIPRHGDEVEIVM